MTQRFFRFRLIALLGVLAITRCGSVPHTPVSPSTGDQWHEFQGTWTAAGRREILNLGTHRRTSIAKLDGSLMLAGPSRPDVGFLSEAIVLNDSVTGMVGRAVWTDQTGDQAYSELRADVTPTDMRIIGTFIGGTGRYSGATGTYEFSWRFLLETEDGTVQGQSVGLKGRLRMGQLGMRPGAGDPRS
jgi:hypothetical protein